MNPGVSELRSIRAASGSNFAIPALTANLRATNEKAGIAPGLFVVVSPNAILILA
ncbi:MAG TPA: hypothetical protein VIQ05_30160 [Tardiphaga sp.]